MNRGLGQSPIVINQLVNKALKGKGARSGIRVIYAYHEDHDKVEFIELYYKGDKEIESRERIGKYYGE